MSLRRVAVAAASVAGVLSLVPQAALAARPHAIQLLLNGKPVKGVPLAGQDYYNDFRARTMSVEARWTGDIRRSGYSIRISTTEPLQKVFASCTSGTRCVVPGRVPLLPGQEMSWQVEVLKTGEKKRLGGFRYCLQGHK